MKAKTSITLSKDLLLEIDARIQPQQRSRRNQAIVKDAPSLGAQMHRAALGDADGAIGHPGLVAYQVGAKASAGWFWRDLPNALLSGY